MVFPRLHTRPFHRALAVLLCFQPPFWMSSVALAQTLPDLRTRSPSGSAPAGEVTPLPARDMPFELEASRAELPVLGPAGTSPVDEPLDPDKYVCGSGDVLELNFWGVQNFKLRVIVDLEGRAFVPKTGYLTLKGKTFSEARRMIREAVSRQWRLSFDVTLAEPRTFLVQVVDDVVRPASYPARAIDRVASIISRAGGFGPDASKRRVEIRRRDGTVLRADLLLYTLTGDVKHNPYLLDGDVVRVPFADLAASIEGAVHRPGRYELIGTRDLAELVELAGGLAPTTTQLLPVSLVRRLPDDRQDQRLLAFTADGGLPAVGIQHEDSVRIPSFTELQQSVMVVGAIKSAPTSTGSQQASDQAALVVDDTDANRADTTRRLPFVKGDSVRTLLERVGGVGPLADFSGSYVLRGGSALPVDLYSLVMLRDLKADRLIELGDTLVIPLKRRNILVEGAVFKPGSYPYNPTYGIEQYLSLAGGRNRFAQSLEDVRVVTPNGEMTAYKPNLRLEPGSSLVVPERNFSRSEVVQIVLGAASIVLSGVAVILSARR